MKKFNFRRAFVGGGKRHGARDVVRGADFAAKQLGSQAAKVGRHCYADNETKALWTKVVSGIKGVRTIRRKDNKSETKKLFWLTVAMNMLLLLKKAENCREQFF